jgi:hypothetical protein
MALEDVDREARTPIRPLGANGMALEDVDREAWTPIRPLRRNGMARNHVSGSRIA